MDRLFYHPTSFRNEEEDRTYVVIGDSISKGIVTDANGLKVTENNAVKLIFDRTNYANENVSKYGQSFSRFVSRGLLKKTIEKYKDIKNKAAIITLGGNDSDYDWQEVAQSPEKEHGPKTPLEEFIKVYTKAVSDLKKNGWIVYCCSLIPVQSQWYFDYVISKSVDGDAVMQFFHGDVTNINRHSEIFSDEIIKIALLNDCCFIDLRKILLKRFDCFEFYCLDGIHLNEKGQKLVADALIDEFLNKD